MISIAQASPAFRSELFRETSRKMKIHEAIIEKDFWVCLTLYLLFTSDTWKNKIIFKGGTSLSKVFSLINRFSEDIDLILDWRELGFTSEDPWKPDSNTKKDRFVKDTNSKVIGYLKDVFIPGFEKELNDRIGPFISLSLDNNVVHLTYPKSFDNRAILPHVILEIGPLAEWTPHKRGTLLPYTAQFFPDQFKISESEVTVVTAERTFWEKATILHQEYNRPNDKSIPPRYSRHYYDLFKMSQTPILNSAISNKDLLYQVIDFKERFYRAPWSGLSEIKQGYLHLAPPKHRYDELAGDYDKMQSMFFSKEPPFNEIVYELIRIEKLLFS